MVNTHNTTAFDNMHLPRWRDSPCRARLASKIVESSGDL